MIFDAHSHAWTPALHFSDRFCAQVRRARAGLVDDLEVRYADYRASAPDDMRTVVFGGKARLSSLWVDDQHIAHYVAQDPNRSVGFLSVDPTQEG